VSIGGRSVWIYSLKELSFVANSPQEGRESAMKMNGWDQSRSQ